MGLFMMKKAIYWPKRVTIMVFIACSLIFSPAKATWWNNAVSFASSFSKTSLIEKASDHPYITGNWNCYACKCRRQLIVLST